MYTYVVLTLKCISYRIRCTKAAKYVYIKSLIKLIDNQKFSCKVYSTKGRSSERYNQNNVK